MCFLPSSKSLTSWAQKLKQTQPKRVTADEVCVNSMQENERMKTLPLENVSISLFHCFSNAILVTGTFSELQHVVIQHTFSYFNI